MRPVRIVHRWLGLLLFVWVTTGTIIILPAVMDETDTTGVAAWVGVLSLEASGGGPINEPASLILITIVAAVGAALFVDRVRRDRGFRAPRGATAWVYFVHRWLGAAFALCHLAYLAARLTAGVAPLALGWTWVLLIFSVNMFGLALLIMWAVGALRRRRRTASTAA